MKPGDELIQNLENLRKSLIHTHDRLVASGVERTQGLKKNLGENCVYYKQSLDLFLKNDYQDIMNLIQRCHELFQLVEGKDVCKTEE